MKTQFSKIPLILTLLIILLAGCKSAETEAGPDETYWKYYEACEVGQYETAVKYLTEDARDRVAAIGACGFTHDAINEYELSRGGTERIFSEDPELTINGNVAAMSWFDNTGNIANVSLIKTEDGWKISESLWSN
jgi:hypothetical protein